MSGRDAPGGPSGAMWCQATHRRGHAPCSTADWHTQEHGNTRYKHQTLHSTPSSTHEMKYSGIGTGTLLQDFPHEYTAHFRLQQPCAPHGSKNMFSALLRTSPALAQPSLSCTCRMGQAHSPRGRSLQQQPGGTTPSRWQQGCRGRMHEVSGWDRARRCIKWQPSEHAGVQGTQSHRCCQASLCRGG